MADSKPFLGRCKSCDYAVFAAEEDLPPVIAPRDVLPGGAYKLGVNVVGRCPNGHKMFRLQQIEGTYSEDFKCDSRCLNAKGRKCTCSCGGMNHGRGHAVKAVPVTSSDLRWKERRKDELRERASDSDLTRAEQRQIEEQAEDVRYPKQHLGEREEKIYFEAKLTDKREINDTVLYIFLTEVRTPVTGELLGEAKVEWWKPDWLDDPGFEVGEVYKLKAKVKRHNDDPRWGKSTVVTYLEEV